MDLEKLHVKFLSGADPQGPVDGRCYTLTHSDFSGELFLSVGLEFDTKAISGFYTRLMRDEVLAEWLKKEGEYSLQVYCHVSGGIILGTAGWRDSIFRHELPLVLRSICNGDRDIFEAQPSLKDSAILVHFKSSNKKIQQSGAMGKTKRLSR